MLELDANYHGSIFFDPTEQYRAFNNRYSAPQARLELIVVILKLAQTAADHESKILARRILKRMLPDLLGSSPSKPLMYTGLQESGVAVALAVYDEFWTQDW
ncbi:hypothetical protein [Umezawaea tangerina]|uniref:hypothetical protein n=1 Tax=Umezawaea tangerina TaxID=84725 RepID=UPI0011B1C718|nr:hypothetical protein [Umezawaea tangerina]